MSTTSGQAQMVGLVGSLFTFGAPSISSKIRGLPLPSATATPPLSLLPHPRWSNHHLYNVEPCYSSKRALESASNDRALFCDGEDGVGEGRERGMMQRGPGPATLSPWRAKKCRNLRSIRK